MAATARPTRPNPSWCGAIDLRDPYRACDKGIGCTGGRVFDRHHYRPAPWLIERAGIELAREALDAATEGRRFTLTRAAILARAAELGRADGERYHAPDCSGSPACGGCGWIDARLRWHAGPCPPWARRFQRLRSELGRRFVSISIETR